MAFNKQTQPVRAIKLDFGLPKEMPKLPEEYTRRYPELAAWNTGLTEWWRNVHNGLHKQTEQIEDAVNAVYDLLKKQ
jgi:hypothetical protein